MQLSVVLLRPLWVLIVVMGLTVLRQSSAQCPIDVLFVLDHSGSISDNDEGAFPNWLYITDMVAEVVRTTARYPDVRYAAISYGTKAEVEFNLDRYTETREIVIAYRAIRNSGGNTNTTGALRLSRTAVWSSLANRPNAFDVLVLVTDGIASERYEAAGLLPEANRVKALGVRLIGIGVTTAVDADLMRRIVSQPASENYFGLANFAQLSSIVESLAQCITRTPTTSTTSSPTPSISTSTTTISTRSTTTRRPSACRQPADVVIVLDASGGRMDFSQFSAVRRFLDEMLTQLRFFIESGAVRVGMVRFADNAVYSFNLNTYLTDFAAIIDAVQTAGYIGGGTNTGLGTSTQ